MSDDDLHELDVERIMQRIRAQARASVNAPARFYPRELDGRLESLRANFDIYHVDVPTSRRLLGPVLTGLRRAARRLLTPILARQVAYNEAAAGVLEDLAEECDAVARHNARTFEELRAVQDEMLATLRREIRAVGDGHEERSTRPTGAEVDLEFDHFRFAERFRGSEDDIKSRQRAYLDHFRGHQDILDVGCGRGEFLELLREAGITARGVDMDADIVRLCREKHLDVTHADAFALLENLTDSSLGGLFAAQLVEHLAPRRVIQLVRLAQRKLRPGAALVLETVNPQCLGVFAESLYLDLSHVRPIHAAAMLFLLEATGFRDTGVRWSSPFPISSRIPALPGTDDDTQAFNRGVARLNELLYGYREYAVSGRKIDQAPPAA